jgi:hypothetical protein
MLGPRVAARFGGLEEDDGVGRYTPRSRWAGCKWDPPECPLEDFSPTSRDPRREATNLVSDGVGGPEAEGK